MSEYVYSAMNPVIKSDPFGLYAFDKSCDLAGRARIERGIYEAWVRCTRCKMDNCEVLPKICDRLKNPPEKFICSKEKVYFNPYDPDERAMAANWGRKEIELGKLTFESNDCIFSETIFHEVAHSVMRHSREDHTEIGDMEEDCFGCGAKELEPTEVRP